MCSIVFSDSKAICLLFVGLSVLGVTGAGTNFTTTPKNKEVFVGSSVQFDWDYIDSEDVEDVRFGVLVPVADSETPREVAIYVKKKDGTLMFNNMIQSIKWIRDRVEVVPGRRASFTIKPVEMEDSRTFFCILMTRSIGSVRSTVKLTVVDLLIDMPPSTKSIESWQGHRLTAVCAVRVAPGGTNAKFSWMHVPSNRVIPRENHDDTGRESYLMLTTYKDEDFEALQCRAETKKTVKFHVINITKLSSPTEPRNLKAERVFNSQTARPYIRLHWDPPKNNGGTMIKSYIVSYVPKGLPWKSSTNSETEKTEFSDLRVPFGNIYKARVRAKNKAGTGPSSNEIEINLEDSPHDSPYSGSTIQLSLEANLLLVLLMIWVL